MARTVRARGRRQLRPWLYKIATNTCLDAIRRRSQARASDRLRPVHSPKPRAGCAAQPTGMGRALRGRVARRLRPRRVARRTLRTTRGGGAGVLSRRSGICRAASAPCSSCARCSDTRPAKSRNCWRQRCRRSTAPSSAPVRPSTSGYRSRASKRRCARVGDERVRELVEGFIDVFETGDVARILAILAQDARLDRDNPIASGEAA